MIEMITSIHLKNFKCFRNIEITDIRNLTLITGKNSAGKSTIIQALVALRDWIISDEKNFSYHPLLGNFDEWVFQKNSDLPVTIQCTIKLPDILVEKLAEEFNHVPDSGWSVIELSTFLTYELIFSRDEIISEVFLLGNDKILNIQSTEFIYLDGKKTDLSWKSRSYQFPLAIDISTGNQRGCQYIAKYLVDYLRETFRNIFYFSPDRIAPDWNQDMSELPDIPSPGQKGEYSVAYLHHLYSNVKEQYNLVESWVRKIDSEITQLLSPIDKTKSRIEIDLLQQGKRIQINIQASGKGIGKIISFLSQIIAAQSDSIFLIEEPDLNLHPGAQKTLLDFFTEMIQNRGHQIVITTHSYTILEEISNRIEKGNSSLEDIIKRLDVLRDNTNFKRQVIDVPTHLPAFTDWKISIKHLEREHLEIDIFKKLQHLINAKLEGREAKTIFEAILLGPGGIGLRVDALIIFPNKQILVFEVKTRINRAAITITKKLMQAAKEEYNSNYVKGYIVSKGMINEKIRSEAEKNGIKAITLNEIKSELQTMISEGS